MLCAAKLSTHCSPLGSHTRRLAVPIYIHLRPSYEPCSCRTRCIEQCCLSMAPKRKGSDEPSTAKKAKASKKKEEEELPSHDDRWKFKEPSIIYIGDDLEGCSKIAALDMDSTLIERTKDYINNPVSYELDSWQWYDDNVPKKLKKLHKDGYKLVIFSNQATIKGALEGKGATKLKAKIDSIIKAAGVPMAVFCGTQKDENRKPDPGMWKFFTAECNGGVEVDLEASFFVGDAAGREYDIGDSDKEFAKNIGVKFHTPEEFFGPGVQPVLRSSEAKQLL